MCRLMASAINVGCVSKAAHGGDAIEKRRRAARRGLSESNKHRQSSPKTTRPTASHVFSGRRQPFPGLKAVATPRATCARPGLSGAGKDNALSELVHVLDATLVVQREKASGRPKTFCRSYPNSYQRQRRVSSTVRPAARCLRVFGCQRKGGTQDSVLT